MKDGLFGKFNLAPAFVRTVMLGIEATPPHVLSRLTHTDYDKVRTEIAVLCLRWDKPQYAKLMWILRVGGLKKNEAENLDELAHQLVEQKISEAELLQMCGRVLTSIGEIQERFDGLELTDGIDAIMQYDRAQEQYVDEINGGLTSGIRSIDVTELRVSVRRKFLESANLNPRTPDAMTACCEGILEVVKKDGILAAAEVRDALLHPYLRLMLGLAIDGIHPHEVKLVTEAHRSRANDEHARGIISGDDRAMVITGIFFVDYLFEMSSPAFFRDVVRIYLMDSAELLCGITQSKQSKTVA